MSQWANQWPYVGMWPMTRKNWALNSMAMRLWSSIGPVADWGSIERSRAAMWPWAISSTIRVASMRAWSAAGSTPGGGHGSPSSQVRRLRKAGSSPSRCDSAVEPVRGRPTPTNSISTVCSSISGWRRYQSSTFRRLVRARSTARRNPCSPMSLSVASVIAERISTSRPSRQVSPPKSSSPVWALASPMSSSILDATFGGAAPVRLMVR